MIPEEQVDGTGVRLGKSNVSFYGSGEHQYRDDSHCPIWEGSEVGHKVSVLGAQRFTALANRVD